MTSQQCHPHQPFSTLQAGRVAATTMNDARLARIESFSTLQAGRVAATNTSSANGWIGRIFQYPPSGSSRCNVGSGGRPARLLCFQYPPSGSSRCNDSTCHAGTRDIRDFQYPPSGSSRCNDDGSAAEWGPIPLSVPSKRVESLQQRC